MSSSSSSSIHSGPFFDSQQFRYLAALLKEENPFDRRAQARLRVRSVGGSFLDSKEIINHIERVSEVRQALVNCHREKDFVALASFYGRFQRFCYERLYNNDIQNDATLELWDSIAKKILHGEEAALKPSSKRERNPESPTSDVTEIGAEGASQEEAAKKHKAKDQAGVGDSGSTEKDVFGDAFDLICDGKFGELGNRISKNPEEYTREQLEQLQASLKEKARDTKGSEREECQKLSAQIKEILSKPPAKTEENHPGKAIKETVVSSSLEEALCLIADKQIDELRDLLFRKQGEWASWQLGSIREGLAQENIFDEVLNEILPVFFSAALEREIAKATAQLDQGKFGELADAFANGEVKYTLPQLEALKKHFERIVWNVKSPPTEEQMKQIQNLFYLMNCEELKLVHKNYLQQEEHLIATGQIGKAHKLIESKQYTEALLNLLKEMVKEAKEKLNPSEKTTGLEQLNALEEMLNSQKPVLLTSPELTSLLENQDQPGAILAASYSTLALWKKDLTTTVTGLLQQQNSPSVLSHASSNFAQLITLVGERQKAILKPIASKLTSTINENFSVFSLNELEGLLLDYILIESEREKCLAAYVAGHKNEEKPISFLFYVFAKKGDIKKFSSYVRVQAVSCQAIMAGIEKLANEADQQLRIQEIIRSIPYTEKGGELIELFLNSPLKTQYLSILNEWQTLYGRLQESKRR